MNLGAHIKTGLSPPVKYFTDRSKAVLLLWIFYVFVLSCVCYVFVRVCLYVLCGHLLGKGWPLGSRLWCLLWVCHFPNDILGQVWYLIVSIPDLCTLTYFKLNNEKKHDWNTFYYNKLNHRPFTIIHVRWMKKKMSCLITSIHFFNILTLYKATLFMSIRVVELFVYCYSHCGSL